MQILKKVLLTIVVVVSLSALALGGLLFWSIVRTDVLYTNQIDTDASFLSQRLCRIKSVRSRTALCKEYSRRIDNADIYCVVDEASGGLAVVVDHDRYENFDQQYRPVKCD